MLYLEIDVKANSSWPFTGQSLAFFGKAENRGRYRKRKKMAGILKV